MMEDKPYLLSIIQYTLVRKERSRIMPVDINMLSSATKIKGQGVGSAYMEQVGLVKVDLNKKFKVLENKARKAPITHYHTVDFKFALTKPFITSKGVSVGYVHMVPETVESSLKLPRAVKKIFYWYMIQFYKSMDYLVTVNSYFIDVLSDKYGISRDKITYIPNYVSSDNFHPVSAEEKVEYKKKYGIPEDKFTVMCAGQTQVRKGIFDFVEIAKKMPDVEFVWAGGFSFGSITDGYKEIQKIIDNPPENVKFLGIIERDNMNEVYNIADVMFLPSFEELFPMTILESMCVHTPVLLRDLPIYEGILFDFYLRANDVDGFIGELDKLRNDKDYYENACALSKKGNEFYSKDHIAKMWDKYYTDVYNSIPEKKRKGTSI